MNIDLITEKIIYHLLYENNKEAAKKNLLKTFNNDESLANQWFDKLLSIDPTKDRPNPSYINKFTKFFIEDPTENHFNDIQETLIKFNILLDKKLWKNKAKKSDINSFRKFDEFKTEVDRIFSDAGLEIEKNDDLNSNIASAQKTLKDIFEIDVRPDHIIYADEDVISVIANQFTFAKKYGSKFSSWCTTKYLNHFNDYKYDVSEDDSAIINSMYFAYFPKRYVINDKDPTSIIHFSLNDENEISYTDQTNNEYEMDLSKLKSEKYFKNEFENKDLSKIFPYIEPTELEEKIIKMPQYISDEEFIRLSDIEKSIFYSIHDTNLSLKMMNSLSTELKNDYVEHMVESDKLIDLIALSSIIDTQAGRRYINEIDDDVILERDILNGLRFISNHYKLSEIKKYKDELLKIPFVKKVIDEYIESGKLSKINHIFNLRTKQKIFYNITDYIDTFEDFDYVVDDPRLKQTIQKLSKHFGKNPTKLFQFTLDEKDLINFLLSYFNSIYNLPNEINIVNQTKRKDKSKHIIDTLFILMENFNSSEKINILKNYILNAILIKTSNSGSALNNSFPSILYIFKKLKSVNVNQMQLQDLLVLSVSGASISIDPTMINSYKNFFIIFKELNILKEFNYETIRKLSNSYENINNTRWTILEYLIDNFTPESKVYNKFDMFTAMFEFVDEDKSLVENLIKYFEKHRILTDTISNFIRVWDKYNPDKKYEFDITKLTTLISIRVGDENKDILVKELEKISGTNILNTIISSMNNEFFGWLKNQDRSVILYFSKKFNNYELKYEIHDKDFNNFKYIIKNYIIPLLYEFNPSNTSRSYTTLFNLLNKFHTNLQDIDNVDEYDDFMENLLKLSNAQYKIKGDTWLQTSALNDKFYNDNITKVSNMLSEQLYKKYTSNLLNYIFN